MRAVALVGLVVGPVVGLVGCPPRPNVTDPTPVVRSLADNRAASLIAAVDRVVALEVVAVDSRRVLGTCDPALLDSVRTMIRGGVREGLTATPPAWPVVVRLLLDGREPFVAHLVGQDRLRLCPEDPWHDCLADDAGWLDPTAAEVAVPFELFEEVARIVGAEPRLEYRAVPVSPASP